MSGTGGVVGRDRELAAVTAFLDALPSGTSCLLLEGAAGIGKTTVWDAGVAGAAARSYLILSGQAGRIRGNAVVRGARRSDATGSSAGCFLSCRRPSG